MTEIDQKTLNGLRASDQCLRSLLQAMGVYAEFVGFEKSLRGRVLEPILNHAKALLIAAPGWNRIRIICAERLALAGEAEKAIVLLEEGLSFEADLKEIQLTIFALHARERGPQARAFIRKVGTRCLYSGKGLALLIAHMRLMQDWEDVVLALSIAAYLCRRGKAVPPFFYGFFMDWALTQDIEEGDDSFLKQMTLYPEEQARLRSILGVARGEAGAGQVLLRAFAGISGLDSTFMGGLSRALVADKVHGKDICSKSVPPGLPFARRLACEAYRGQRLERLALCISGQARDMARAAPGIQAFARAAGVQDKDVFFSTWETNGVRFPTSTNLNHLDRIMPLEVVQHLQSKQISGPQILDRWPSIAAWMRDLDAVSLQSIRNLYPGAHISIHSDPFGDAAFIAQKYGGKWVSAPNQLRMFHLVREGVAAALEAASYDVIIRLRPDALLEVDKWAIAQEIARVRADPALILVDRIGKPGVPSDSFAMGSAYAMAWYAALADTAWAYAGAAYYPKKITPHVILHDHLVSGGLCLAEAESVRINGFASPAINGHTLQRMVKQDAAGRGPDPLDESVLNVLRGRSPEVKSQKDKVLLLTTWPAHKSGNVGDALITASALKLIRAQAPRFAPDATLFREEALDGRFAKGEVRAVIAPGFSVAEGTYPTLFRLWGDMAGAPPIYPLGCSFQAPFPGRGAFDGHVYSAQTLDFLKGMAERTGPLPCRDALIVEVLERHGVPAVYSGDMALYDPDVLGRPFTLPPEIRAVAFTVGHHPRYQAQALTLLTRIKAAFPGARLLCAYHSKPGAHPLAVGAAAGALGYEVADLHGPAENLAAYDGVDLHIGYRLHGHAAFLRARKPSILLVEDARAYGIARTPGIGVGCVDAWDEGTEAARPEAPEEAMAFALAQARAGWSAYAPLFAQIDQTYAQVVVPAISRLTRRVG